MKTFVKLVRTTSSWMKLYVNNALVCEDQDMSARHVLEHLAVEGAINFKYEEEAKEVLFDEKWD